MRVCASTVFLAPPQYKRPKVRLSLSKKMNMTKILSFFCVLVLLNGCVTQKQKKGDVAQKEFRTTLTFAMVKFIPVIPVDINGEGKNFLFDTGADLTVVQRDTLKGKVTKFSGASNRKMELGSEIISSLIVGDANFRNTAALNGNLTGLKEQIPAFGGLIGTPIIQKANWLFNFSTKKLTVSNANLADETFQSIKIKRKSGAPYTSINIDGKEYDALIDMGSSAGLSIPENSPLAKELLKKYKFEEIEREVFTLGGLQKVKEKTSTLPKLKIGNIEFKDVNLDIRPSSQMRIGSRFFQDYILYIDNINRDFKIKMK